MWSVGGDTVGQSWNLVVFYGSVIGLQTIFIKYYVVQFSSVIEFVTTQITLRNRWAELHASVNGLSVCLSVCVDLLLSYGRTVFTEVNNFIS